MTPKEPETVAWRYLSNAKDAKWTVQKNYPEQVAKWPGYTVEPLYSEASIVSLRGEIEGLRKERKRANEVISEVSVDLTARAMAAEAEVARMRDGIERITLECLSEDDGPVEQLEHILSIASALSTPTKPG